MIGTTVTYENREMGQSYLIACFHTCLQLSDEELEVEMCKILGCDRMNDRERCHLTFIDHNKLRGLTLLGEQIDNKTEIALKRFFPESLKDLHNNEVFGNFSYLYRDSKAKEVIWMNKYYNDIKGFVRSLQISSAKLYDEESARE